MKTKKRLMAVLALATICVGVFGLASCGENENKLPPLDASCVHEYITDEAVAATCEKTGLTAGFRCSKCGGVAVAQEEVPAKGHSFVDYISDNNATCAKNGTETAVCDRENCSAKNTREVANSMLSHEVSKTWSYDYTHHWHASACACDEKHNYAEHTVDGYGNCTVCGHLVTPTSGVVYDVSADGTYAEVIDYTGSGGDVVISDTYNGLPVTNIYQNAFYNKATITSVLMSNSVTNIGNNAFYYCTSLTSVIIGDGVMKIGEYAFGNCSNLMSVKMGNSVTSIGGYAFSSCRSLAKIVFSDHVISIERMAFSHSGLQSIVIGDGVTSVGEYAFQNCYSLTHVSIGDGVMSIGDGVFRDCSNLTNVTIGNNITSISSSAFSRCNSLQYNEYGNAKYLGNAENPYYALIVPISSNISSCIIHEDVKIIVPGAFENCSRLKEVVVPDSVTNIKYAFSRCYIEKATIPASVCSDIRNNKLKEVIITSGDSISNYAFSYCYSLTSVTIPDSVTSIGDSAFSDCTSLTEIVIPDSVTSIGYGAFLNCTSLTSITYNGTMQEWKAIEKGNAWNANVPATEVVCTNGRVFI